MILHDHVLSAGCYKVRDGLVAELTARSGTGAALAGVFGAAG